jgi:hypothetical protein
VPDWSEVQWQLFKDAYQHEIEDCRLAHKVIPAYPVDRASRTVKADTFDYKSGFIDDVTQTPLETREKTFRLTHEQVADQDLASALVIIRRKAQELARSHDKRVFKRGIRDRIVANVASKNYHDIVQVARIPDGSGRLTGDGLLPATAAAVAKLDRNGYRSGFVMVAGAELFKLLYTRAPGAADLPVVAVRGLLGDGAVHRSTVLPNDEALVLSIGGGRIDRAVAIAPIAEFLRTEKIHDPRDATKTIEADVGRLYEVFITRFKETRSAVLLQLESNLVALGVPAPGGPVPGGPVPGGPVPGGPVPGGPVPVWAEEGSSSEEHGSAEEGSSSEEHGSAEEGSSSEEHGSAEAEHVK